MGLDEQMAEMMRKINRAVPTAEAKKQITKVGANKFADVLQKNTRASHYQDRKLGKVKHLADSIKVVNKDLDGVQNGNSTVGFEDASDSGINHGRIARFLNDGTSHHLKGDHFVDKARDESKDEVFQAMADKYQEGFKRG
ncbi:HK97-gp10 family putative phage morphogenesis protein [Fructilactobacillus lindneri]|uniref:HK97 gp10 family phage protein n=1 Tax=Fructilactobacillus lindneri DSM 20690 = JCM 11027 TaxID=1122148 RepID=A0A0R2JYR9_9LACO|nr:HK97-gp10 family putative phage morphogenesis protein [Fructilactobacillus lindneri]KRN80646.1 hypothetical protein IV52_GL001200 [Fructilactobacillus lindneri DSM 20690 = JCM 11027]POH07501.1 hypothetical protein BGL35_00025 [Fructilactobacillus lindneri]POH08574.1 hypothetical protein BGL36_00060 [Fructilactobacillus lindneri]POH24912.1 hypothetical protein BHU33_02700 [Fructilactobacillus lindneri DSM 20690 = JCM 11027]SKA10886.1 phage protein, HK97 gp10 family [Fructilactobacillus lindn